MFSHSRRGDDHSVCLCLGFKVISSSASEQWSVAGLICKILLLQNVDNYLFQLNFDCFDSYSSFTDGLCHLRFTKIEVVASTLV